MGVSQLVFVGIVLSYRGKKKPQMEKYQVFQNSKMHLLLFISPYTTYFNHQENNSLQVNKKHAALEITCHTCEPSIKSAQSLQSQRCDAFRQ